MLLYEGKAKQIFSTENPDEVVIYFKDSATAYNGIKKDIIEGKGRVNLRFTRYFFDLLHLNDVKTHIIDYLDDLSLKAQKVEIIPLEVVIRNYAAGSICKRLGYEKGFKFTSPVCEFFLKDDSLGDPLISKQEIFEKMIISKDELDCLENLSLKVNSVLSEFLDLKNIILVDFKLEFGKNSKGEILLADEISPDTCRFWKKGTFESLDKDVYREDKGSLIESYHKLANILEV